MIMRILFFLMFLQTTRASEFLDSASPLRIAKLDSTSVDLSTSRRIDDPSILYTFSTVSNLTGNWTTVATYSGDGSSFLMDHPGFSISNDLIDAEFEQLSFYQGLEENGDETFYRVTSSAKAVPIETYADEFDASFVQIRSLDSDKLLFHSNGADYVEYATDLSPADTRAHWSIGYSVQSNRYWITNRETGESINVEQQNSGTPQRVFLIDFGTDSTYRGLSVSSPDVNGNTWNEVGYGPAYNLVDTSSNSTPFDLIMTSSFGTDSFNGPAGGGNPPDPSGIVFNAAALGDLGVTNAVYDYFAGVETFEIRDLNPAREYSLTFFGSHKFNADDVTVYSITDSNGVVQASVNLTIGSGSNHNTDSVVSIGNVTPEANGTIYVSFSGETGNSGYLNAMRIEELATIGSGTGNLQMGVLQPTFTSYRWKFLPEPGYFRIESGWVTNDYFTVGDAAAGTATYAPLDTNDDGQKFVVIPLPKGALLPWASYDEDNYAEIGGGASVLPPTYDRLLVQSEAQKRSVIELGSEGAYATWSLFEQANAFVLRYAIEDAPLGGGTNGTLMLTIRNQSNVVVESKSIPVTSEQAWVYFDTSMVESDDPSHGRPAKRYNEARIKTDVLMEPGYTLELLRDTGEPFIWLDVIETEWIESPVVVDVPGTHLSVVDYGAVPDDGVDDLASFNSCIAAAKSAGKGVYIPSGTFDLSSRILVSDVSIQGAGMWHTELHFTAYNQGKSKSGFWGEGNSVIIRDLYIWSNSDIRDGSGDAFRQYFGTGSMIENVWMEQVGVGVWIGKYDAPYLYTDGLIVRSCRIRNTFADGLNYAHGTRNSIVENCHVRQTGDDSLATWSSGAAQVPQCFNNVFRYNTVECTYRASGVGVFGGESHRVHHNVISDSVSGTAIRFNTTFAENGYDFSTNGTHAVYNNLLKRSGTLGGYGTSPAEYGAINLVATYGDVRNISFSNILIDDVMNNGIYVNQQTYGTGGVITNVVFDAIRMARVPTGVMIRSASEGELTFGDVNIQLDPVRGIDSIQNLSDTFVINGLAAGRTEFEDYSAYYDTTPGNTGGVYRDDAVDIEVSGQGGYNVGWIDAGEWLEFTFTNSTAGTYTLSCSAASASGGGDINVLINGIPAVELTVPPTGGWQNWSTIQIPIDLSYGEFSLRFEMETGGFNLDWFELE